MRKNFWIDVFMFVSALICIATGIMLDFHLIEGGREVRKVYKDIHIYSGYIMAVLLIIHLALHTGWIKNSFKNICHFK